MNRRDFLKTSSVSALAVAGAGAQSTILPTPPPPRPPHTPPKSPAAVNTATFHAASTAQAICFANQFRGNATGQDLRNVASALSAVRANWIAAQLDTRLIPRFNATNERDIAIAKVPVATITQQMNVYNPAVTQTVVRNYVQQLIAKSVVGGVDYRTVTLQKLRAGGMSTLMAGGINAFNSLALTWPAPKLNPATHAYYPQIKVIPPEPSGGNNCTGLGLAALGLGIASVTLTVMTGGTDILVLAVWEAIAVWSGIGATVLDVAHDFMC